MKITGYESIQSADEKLAEKIVTLIEKLSVQKNGVILALSGGSTPFEMYKLLSEELSTLDCEIHIVQVDERFVSKTNPRSNQKQLKSIFTKYNFHPMVTPDETNTVQEAVTQTMEKYEALFNSLNTSAPDLTLLGMGADGHTASLFPQNETYLQSKDDPPGIIGMYVESQDEERISLNTSLINLSTYKILYAHGSEKLKTLNMAIKTDNADQYPILCVMDNLELVTVKNTELWNLSDKWKIQSFE